MSSETELLIKWIVVGSVFGLAVGVCLYEIVTTVFKAIFGKEKPKDNRSIES